MQASRFVHVSLNKSTKESECTFWISFPLALVISAISRAVLLLALWFFALMFTLLCLERVKTTSLCKPIAARCNGVFPFLSTKLIKFSISGDLRMNDTIFQFPCLAATWRMLRSLLLRISIASGYLLISSFKTFSLPFSAAK